MAKGPNERLSKARVVRLGDREVVTEGLHLNFWADISHRCMTASWPAFIGGAALVFVAFNAFFAAFYWVGDQPISNVPGGAYIDYLYFSIETLSTAGYGDMHPQTHYGHFIAAVELFTGIFSMSLMTGLIFARFSRPSARLLFADNPVISDHEGEPTLMIPLLVFLAAFEVFFIGVVMFLGPTVMAQLTWWGIVVANMTASAVMLSYFLARHPALARNLLGAWIRIFQEGLTAGLIGAVVVAAWFLAYDVASGDAFRTPLLLGEAIFNGAMPATQSTVLPLILGYTVIHFMAFIALGVALAILMAATDREPLMALGVLVVFAIFEVFFLGWVTLIDASLLEQLGWWKIIAANALALIAMVAYAMRTHRGVVLRLQERWAALESEGDEATTPTPRR